MLNFVSLIHLPLRNKNFKLLTLVLFIGVFSATTYWIGFYQNNKSGIHPNKSSKWESVNFILDHLLNSYVDSIDSKDLKQKTIQNILKDLDPHSSYIPADKRISANESLVGHFGGVGIRFMILRDTLTVVGVIEGGPSAKNEIEKRDRIIEINGENVASIGLTNEDVLKKLKGKIGTKVELKILNKNQLIVEKTIIRDQIKLKSIVSNAIIAPGVGYIKITTFSNSTDKELQAALKSLQNKGMKKLILDLRFNGGGYLHQAINVADEFLKKDQMIVYTEGAHSPKMSQYATNAGLFKEGALAILVNSTTASASEIVSGAIQDHKRGIIVGRRTFGKGLVQSPLMLSDSSEIRITTSRYYTPLGRCIQKPYGDTINYEEDLINRIANGELSNKDSLTNDLAKGGIWPDAFSPIDTSNYLSPFYNVIYSQPWRDFCFDFYENNPETIYKELSEFNTNFSLNKKDLNAFLSKAGLDKIVDTEDYKMFNKSIKLELSSYYFTENERYIISAFDDNDVQLAVKLINN